KYFRVEVINLILIDRLLDILNSNAIYSTEWTLANYFLDSENHSGDIPIQKAAEDCHVSEATVSRFIKKIGYTNYIEFRNDYSHSKKVSDLRIFNINKNSLKLLEDNPSQFLEVYKSKIQQTLQHSVETLNLEKIDQFLGDIKCHNNIFIFGMDTSIMFADIIQYNLINYNKVIYLGNTVNQQYDYAKN